MRTSTARGQWNGVLKSGNGTMNLGQTSFPFSFNSRMEGGQGGSPEDMLAAALAGCYSMALSADLEKAGFPATQVSSNAKARFDNGSGKWTVEAIDLDVEA
ncbi:MAG TPA: OsmC family peroxiredoxin, partial [Candidatus Kapabacteria bacterium]